MNDNTILRIKVPAHLYESVKKQLTLKESKNRLSEAISGTDEELMAFYEKVKQMEAEGTDLESAISYAKFDIENPDAAKELSSMNEAKKSGKAFGDWTVVKEKKLPKDGMKKVEETIEETNENMEKKTRTLDELKKAKDKLNKKIEEMEMSSKKNMDEGSVNETAMQMFIDAVKDLNPSEIVQAMKLGLNMTPNELQNFLFGSGAIGTVGGTLAAAGMKDRARKKAADAANKPGI